MTKYLLLSLLAVGCQAPHTTLSIDAGLSAETRAALESTAEEWAKAGAFIEITDRQGAAQSVREVNVVVPDHANHEAGELIGWSDANGIQILRGLPAAMRWHTLAHELGHFLGAKHTRGGLMVAGVDEQTAVHCIDVAAAEQIGLTATCQEAPIGAH